MAIAKDVVVQTRVTAAQYKTIEAAASEQGTSVAAFVRAATMQQATAPLVRAWVTHYGEVPSTVLAHDRLPHYMLKRIVGTAGEQAFAMFLLAEHGLVPVSRAAVTYEMDFLKRPALHQFVLDGSQTAWFVVRSSFNSSTNVVEIVLRAEGGSGDVIRRRIYNAKKAWLSFEMISGQKLRGRVDVTGIGLDSCELEVEGEPTRTIPYSSVLAISNTK